MILKEVKGNLFNVDEKYALAHCISQDCKMGAGIAVEFDRRFPGMKDYCKRVLIQNHLSYPVTIPYYEEEQPVYNLVTKDKFWNKPTYSTIRQTIKEMASYCKHGKVHYLAMPLIGCGLDRLSWTKVKEIIKEEFYDIDIEILIVIKER